MTPSEYYYGPFREQFHQFWRSLDTCGSVSRVRSRYHTSRFANQSDLHFSVIDLVADPANGFVDHLQEIPKPDHIDFLCALHYLILTDQVIYAHRMCDYDAFHDLTLYPKMDRTVGYARMLLMANPYELFSDEIFRGRGIEQKALETRFAEWATFVVSDLRAFFTKHAIGTTTWMMVRDAMLNDHDCTRGAQGIMLRKALEACDPA